MPQPVRLLKVHKRTFLTIAQIIIIVHAIPVLLVRVRGFGVYILAAGTCARDIPGYDHYVNQFGDAVLTSRDSLLHRSGVPIMVGIVDIILGISWDGRRKSRAGSSSCST